MSEDEGIMSVLFSTQNGEWECDDDNRQHNKSRLVLIVAVAGTYIKQIHYCWLVDYYNFKHYFLFLFSPQSGLSSIVSCYDYIIDMAITI